MPTKEQEKETLVEELNSREAGVAEVFEMYQRIEKIYFKASEALASNEDSHTTNTTNLR